MKQDQRLYDKLREEDLEAQGYQIVRVTTDEIKQDIDGTLRKILSTCQSSPRDPSPAGEGEVGEAEHTSTP